MAATHSSVAVELDDTRASDAPAHASPRALLDLRGFWLFLRRRARLIAGTTLALMTLAVVTLFLIPPRYTATADHPARRDSQSHASALWLPLSPTLPTGHAAVPGA